MWISVVFSTPAPSPRASLGGESLTAPKLSSTNECLRRTEAAPCKFVHGPYSVHLKALTEIPVWVQKMWLFTWGPICLPVHSQGQKHLQYELTYMTQKCRLLKWTDLVYFYLFCMSLSIVRSLWRLHNWGTLLGFQNLKNSENVYKAFNIVHGGFSSYCIFILCTIFIYITIHNSRKITAIK